MNEFIEYVSKWMVDDPDAVSVELDQQGDRANVRLRVHEDDMGRIIGRDGRLATAMRSLLSVAGNSRGVTARLDIDY